MGGVMVHVVASRTSYDFDSMTDEEKIDFFFKNRMPRWFLPALKSAMEERQEFMLVGLLIMVGIDVLSGYFAGEKSSRETFVMFVVEYFDYFMKRKTVLKQNRQCKKNVLGGRLNDQKELCLPEILYGIFRCGLAHSFMIYEGGSFTRSKRYYVRRYKHKGYHIDINRLYTDFFQAYSRFEQDVRKRNVIRGRFLNRFNVLWKRG
jgi:hypothetical protein